MVPLNRKQKLQEKQVLFLIILFIGLYALITC